MSITFGSVGDIISVCLLVKDLIATLDESRGSASEYQNLVHDLRNLDHALQELDHLGRICDHSSDYAALGAMAKQQGKDCRGLLEDCYEKVKTYNKHLDGSGESHVLADTYWKLHWRITRKNYVAQFKTQLQSRIIAITMLLVTANLYAYRSFQLPPYAHALKQYKCAWR